MCTYNPVSNKLPNSFYFSFSQSTYPSLISFINQDTHPWYPSSTKIPILNFLHQPRYPFLISFINQDTHPWFPSSTKITHPWYPSSTKIPILDFLHQPRYPSLLSFINQDTPSLSTQPCTQFEPWYPSFINPVPCNPFQLQFLTLKGVGGVHFVLGIRGLTSV